MMASHAPFEDRIDFAEATTLLEAAVDDRAFPAAVIEVGTSSRVLWQGAFGRLHDDPEAPPTALDSVFDLASLTKPLASTTLVLQLVDRGRLLLEDEVKRWLPQWRGSDRDRVTVGDLLAHCSGLTAHLPLYRDHEGWREFEATICSLPLEYAAGTRAVYSDLGFILLGLIVERVADRGLDGQFAALTRELGISELAYRPPIEWRARTAPTGLDAWRGRVLQGEVHDRNAWALGGVAGHAGLFGTASAVGALSRAWLAPFLDTVTQASPLAAPELLRAFARRTAIPGSSRALGWDTMRPTSSCGTLMHATAIGHTGYTGTSLWLDLARDLYVVLLTNRVHPTDRNEAILAIRPRVHDAIVRAVLGGPARGPS
jgi:CubicO group peptidase (beta-lactamase class C family)